jgi:hypothetical protein
MESAATNIHAEALLTLKVCGGTLSVTVSARFNKAREATGRDVSGNPFADMIGLSRKHFSGPMLALPQYDLEGVYPVFTPRVDRRDNCGLPFFRNLYLLWKNP